MTEDDGTRMPLGSATEGLMIEPLEQRQLLSVCQWTGAAGNGDWSNAANWLKNQIPTASDDAAI